MLIVRDLLDGKLRDTFRREIGRVDGIVLEVEPGAPPRVAWLEAGGPVAWRRVYRSVARLDEALRRRWGARQAEPARFPWSVVASTEDGLRVTVDADRTPAMAWELWLREHVVHRIPFNGRRR
jgi:sugar phosphate isomerase/epimerase